MRRGQATLFGSQLNKASPCFDVNMLSLQRLPLPDAALARVTTGEAWRAGFMLDLVPVMCRNVAGATIIPNHVFSRVVLLRRESFRNPSLRACISDYAPSNQLNLTDHHNMPLFL